MGRWRWKGVVAAGVNHRDTESTEVLSDGGYHNAMPFDIDSLEFQLMRAVAERVVNREAADGYDALSRDERVYYLVWIADGEVNNGGMHAVCYNSTGDYLRELPAAFRTIGSPERAALFEALIGLFGADGPARDHARREEQHEAMGDEIHEQIDALDHAYYSVEDDLEEGLWRLAESIWF